MRRGDIWWAQIPEPVGDRPVILLSRDSAYTRLSRVVVTPITTRIRGIRVEVVVGATEGLTQNSVANLDTILTLPLDSLRHQIGHLSAPKMQQVEDALRLALALPKYHR